MFTLCKVLSFGDGHWAASRGLGGFLRAMGDFYGVEVFVLANAGRHCLWGCLGTGIVRVASLGEQS